MFRSAVLLILALALPICAGAQSAHGKNVQAGVEMARARVYPALVNITVVMRYYQGGRAQRTPGGGSGVIISSQGHVLTNYHVAGNTTRIVCTLTTGESIEATVVCHDLPTDLSILKLRTEKRENPHAPLRYAKLGDSDALQIGETVIAMGNPLMLSSSLSVGVVANTRRVFTDFTGTEMDETELDQDERTGMFTRWIQHDALILPGNSGGPLVNTRGEVVGINELGGGGIGFAIPSNTARRVIAQGIRGGEVRRGWLGIAVLPVKKLGRTTGALVSAVTPGAPAERAGIQPGDILLSIAGRPANVRFFEQVPALYQSIADMTVGDQVPIKLLRAGSVKQLAATIALMPPFTGQDEEVRKLGITVKGITTAMMLSRKLATREGVLVTGTRAGYPAESANPPVREGDVITGLYGKHTPTLAAFRAAVKEIGGSDVAVEFRRQDESLVTALKIDKETPTEEGGELPKAWLGVKTQVVTPEVARVLGIPDTHGFRVTEVYPWTEASRCGLKEGDIITAINDTALDAYRPQDAEDLKRAVEDLPVGQPAKVTILRSSKPSTVQVKMEAMPSSTDQAKKSKSDDFEFAVRDIVPLDRMERRWRQDQTGVIVVDSVAGGWANMAGLHVDDLILGIQDQPVADVASFAKAMTGAAKRKPKVIEIYVKRGYRTHFVFIEPDWARLGPAR